jgi:cell wall-associated NlpC family hydrolase
VPGYRWYAFVPHRRLLASILVALLLILSGQSVAQAATAAISEAQNEAQALIDLIDQLNQELGAATEDYNYANQQFTDSEAAAKKLSAELEQAEADLASTQDRFNQRVVEIYKTGSLSMLGVVLDASSFSEMLSRLDDLAVISQQDAKIVDQIAEYKADAADKKADLEIELQQQAIYAAQTAEARLKVLDQLDKQKEALKGKEAQIAQLKKEEAARQARLAAEERARQAFLASRPGKVINYAMGYLGVPYVWGGSSPKGFDCSGLVQYVYAKVGISLPHSSRMQYSCGTPVSKSQLKAGDLVFYWSPIQHVGIYLGNGRIINATGNQVQISDAFTRGYVGACRVF